MTGASSAADLVCQLINIDHVSSRDGANPMSRELTMPVLIFGAEKVWYEPDQDDALGRDGCPRRNMRMVPGQLNWWLSRRRCGHRKKA
jgi:hypothetical protein